MLHTKTSTDAGAREAERGRGWAKRGIGVGGPLLVGLAGWLAWSSSPVAQAGSFGSGQFLPVQASTVPRNGDTNPYGVAFVPDRFPPTTVHPHDVLVSNFNNNVPQSGTGSTIVAIAPDGKPSVFFDGHPTMTGEFGLTTALFALEAGFVIVGNLPTLDGTPATIQAPGSLLVLDANGNVVDTLQDANLLDGPWDLTVDEDGCQAHVFVSNVLSGTVSRIDVSTANGQFQVEGITQVASGYKTATDPMVLVLGPTGLAFDDKRDILYVASTLDNMIFAIKDAEHVTNGSGTGTVVFADVQHLHGPLGLTFGPEDRLFAANGDAVNTDPNHVNTIIEFTPGGRFIAQYSIDPGGAGGAAFGLGFDRATHCFTRFGAVDDDANLITIFTLSQQGGR